jgi:hypothetical protein
MKRFVLWAVGILVVLAVIGAIVGGGDEEANEPAQQEQTREETKAAEPREQPFRATRIQISAFLVEELGDETDYDRPRVRRVECPTRDRCIVQYSADTPVFDVEDMLLEEQRPIWEKLFSDSRLEAATLVPHGMVTSVGGQESVSPVMRVTCNRAAHRQIDWDNVDADGMRALCNFVALVDFE